MTLTGREQIQAGTLIWAAGVTANGLSRGLGFELSDHGRIAVDSRLQVADHPDVFAVGDVAAVTQPGPGGRCRCSRRRPGHAVENSIVIAAPAEKVFDYVTDVRREPEWNPQLREFEKLTPGPIGAGTKYRVRFGRGVDVAIIENTGFDWPRSWSAGSTSRRLDVRFQGQVTEIPGGCQLAVRNELFLHGVPRALSPFLRLLIRRSWEQDLRAIKRMADVGGPDDGVGSEQRDERAVRRSRPALWTFGAGVGAALIRRPRSVRPRRGTRFSFALIGHGQPGKRQRLFRGRARCDDGLGDQYCAMQGLSWPALTDAALWRRGS